VVEPGDRFQVQAVDEVTAGLRALYPVREDRGEVPLEDPLEGGAKAVQAGVTAASGAMERGLKTLPLLPEARPTPTPACPRIPGS